MTWEKKFVASLYVIATSVGRELHKMPGHSLRIIQAGNRNRDITNTRQDC